MLPVVVGVARTLDHIIAYSVVLVGVSFLLIPTGVVGLPYTIVAVILGVAVIGASVWLRRHEDQGDPLFPGVERLPGGPVRRHGCGRALLMDVLRDVFMVVAAILVACGCVAVAVLEFGSSAERRLVSRLRDVVEVLLPPALALVLVWIVWFDRI